MVSRSSRYSNPSPAPHDRPERSKNAEVAERRPSRPKGVALNDTKRKCAALVAAVSLNLGLVGTCAEASYAPARAARQIASHPHAQSAKRLRANAARSEHGLKHASSGAPRKLHLVATAYIPACAGCSGVTRTGTQAGRGVVAVDPHVIPLGTKLYVPAYGHALAGDTGGDIKGRRIDLGFDSSREARRFGRQKIVVYVLPSQKRSGNR
jgi:3D (Asp-Asp-Asp) domain-containing protein